MSSAHIKHFLVIYNIPMGIARVEPFDDDYEAALATYSRLEEVHREDPDVEVVLLGSDSLETLHRTHSSYFDLSEKHLDHVVGSELAELGLR
jgi:hypothetical protein